MLLVMAIFTLTEIEELQTEWKNAALAVARGKSYKIGDRELTRAYGKEIQQMLEWLEEQKQAISGNSGPAVVSGRVGRSE